jgi:hypothetical protein
MYVHRMYAGTRACTCVHTMCGRLIRVARITSKRRDLPESRPESESRTASESRASSGSRRRRSRPPWTAVRRNLSESRGSSQSRAQSESRTSSQSRAQSESRASPAAVHRGPLRLLLRLPHQLHRSGPFLRPESGHVPSHHPATSPAEPACLVDPARPPPPRPSVSRPHRDMSLHVTPPLCHAPSVSRPMRAAGRPCRVPSESRPPGLVPLDHAPVLRYRVQPSHTQNGLLSPSSPLLFFFFLFSSLLFSSLLFSPLPSSSLLL